MRTDRRGADEDFVFILAQAIGCLAMVTAPANV